jgi:hypothetical protein
MQTFLPYGNFDDSVECLDRLRLGKQRVEVYQLLKALRGESTGWVNHPAAKMWRGHTNALVYYGITACNEWLSRGYNDTCKAKISAYVIKGQLIMPPWLGDEAFHASHRSNLLRKDSAWYGQFGWTEPHDLPYIWPTNEG